MTAALLDAAELEAEAVAEYQQTIRELVAEHPNRSDRELAEMVVSALQPDHLRALLVHRTTTEVYIEKRSQARQIEREARSHSAMPIPTPRQEPSQPVPTPPSPTDPVDGKFEEIYSNPCWWGRPEGRGLFINSRERTQFRSWCNRRDGRGGFDRWLAAALDQDVTELFRQDFVPGYTRDQHWAEVSKLVNDFANKIRFDITAELLDSIFSTGDGTRVTWREATVAQHQERIDSLSKHIAGTAETAAMHQRAVQMIESAGVQTLGEVPA